LRIAFALLAAFCGLQTALAQEADTPPHDLTAAPVKQTPHFAALRADKVALRSGPSTDYPIEWVFVRKNLPVEILTAFDIWRKIRDFEGTEGWVQQGLLTGRRSVLVTGTVRDLRSDPAPEAKIVARLQPGVIASLSRCDPGWCEVKIKGYRGWLKRDAIWGLEPGEAVP
jgi:SH3-like domain-containing protein